ncbi:unnamed protein product [Leuciscus chuanchicus]
MEVENFVSKTLELLQEEREAELEETRAWQENLSPKNLQHKGVFLMKLQIGSQHTGMYGRRLIVFEPRKSIGPSVLPSNTFGPGDIIGLYQSEGQPSELGSGVVTRVTQASLTVAFDDTQDSLNLDRDGLYNLMKLANNVTYRRLSKALKSLNGYSNGPASYLISVLFGYSEPGILSHQHVLEFSNTGLDNSQKEAVSFAMSQKDVAIIHGPPGTGKTTTVVEVILQAVKQEQKILCCAPSNVAVDNLVERLVKSKVKVLRLGHPARLLESIQKHSLDAVLAHSDNTNIISDIRKDMDKAFNEMKKARDKGQRSNLKREIGELRRELRTREETAITQILKRADVILATNTGNAASKGLSVSLMERLIKKYGDSVVRMLTTQYRMNSAIMQWASEQMYQGKLFAHPSVEKHLLRDLAGVADVEETRIPLLLIDTAGCGLNEMEDTDEQSKGNQGEVDIVALHIKALTEAGVHVKDIAVIAPYNLQVDLLRQKLSHKYTELEIKSVDGFQGREKEAVVLSMVRSNRKGEVGFLAEDRRINVAVTRARRQLAVVCDTQTVRNHDFLKSLVDYMSEHGELHTAFEYLEDCVPQNYIRDEKDKQTNAKDAISIKQKPKNQGKKSEQEYKKSANNKSSEASQSSVQPDRHKNTNSLHSKPKDVNQTLNKRKEIKDQLLNFLTDPNKTELQFPSTLNSHERLLVHELSEEMGLRHESQGEGKNRRITVSRPPSGPEKPVKEPEQPDMTGCTAAKTQEESQKASSQKASSQAAIDLKSLHLERMRREQEKREEKKQQSMRPDFNASKNQSVKKPKASSKGSTKIKAGAMDIAAAATADDDFDSLIDSVVKADSVCGFVKCKASVLTLGQLCLHCNRQYCLSHHIPEVHGCGDKAKAQARMRISKEGVLYAGSGQKDKSMDPNKKAYLQRKLDSKLKDMSSQRKTKVKDKEN